MGDCDPTLVPGPPVIGNDVYSGAAERRANTADDTSSPSLSLPGLPDWIIGLVAIFWLCSIAAFAILSFVIGEDQTHYIGNWLAVGSSILLVLTLGFDYLRRHGNWLFFK